jgi:prolipoprotein diacylglyceryltransferase
MFPTIQFGPLSIQAPGLMILLGIWLGLSLAERFANRYGVTSDLLSNLVIIFLIAGAIGGRLVYALRYLDAFIASPLSLFSFNPGLFDLWGGFAIGSIAALVFGQRKGLNFWLTLDALTPALAVFSVGLGLAHLASGSAFGKPTDLPWGIELWGMRRHPSQVYEIVASLTILGILLFRIDRNQSPPGSYFLTFIAMIAGTRLFLETFRGDSSLVLDGIRLAQIIAWIVLAFALLGLEWLKERANHHGTF